MVLFSLYGTVSIGCQGGDEKSWFREAGLSEPVTVWLSRKVFCKNPGLCVA
jgi:hypothetical protein